MRTRGIAPLGGRCVAPCHVGASTDGECRSAMPFPACAHERSERPPPRGIFLSVMSVKGTWHAYSAVYFASYFAYIQQLIDSERVRVRGRMEAGKSASIGIDTKRSSRRPADVQRMCSAGAWIVATMAVEETGPGNSFKGRGRAHLQILGRRREHMRRLYKLASGASRCM